MTLVKLSPNGHAEVDVTILDGSDGEVAYAWKADTDHTSIRDLLVLHDCPESIKPWSDENRAAFAGWHMTGVGAHDLISADPLHIEASVYWPDCCGLHGFIRDGRWNSA